MQEFYKNESRIVKPVRLNGRRFSDEDGMRMGNNAFSVDIDGSHCIDQQNRQIVWPGINMVGKDKTSGYVSHWDQANWESLRAWGFHVIRLGLIWDGIEPNPGPFDRGYLARIRILIKDAARYGLAVILDMHQDLYGVDFSDGAPSWATITDGAMVEPTDPWGAAYLVSAAVKRAFDHFWANDPRLTGGDYRIIIKPLGGWSRRSWPGSPTSLVTI